MRGKVSPCTSSFFLLVLSFCVFKEPRAEKTNKRERESGGGMVVVLCRFGGDARREIKGGDGNAREVVGGGWRWHKRCFWAFWIDRDGRQV